MQQKISIVDICERAKEQAMKTSDDPTWRGYTRAKLAHGASMPCAVCNGDSLFGQLYCTIDDNPQYILCKRHVYRVVETQSQILTERVMARRLVYLSAICTITEDRTSRSDNCWVCSTWHYDGIGLYRSPTTNMAICTLCRTKGNHLRQIETMMLISALTITTATDATSPMLVYDVLVHIVRLLYLVM